MTRTEDEAARKPRAASGVTVRAIAIGLIVTVLIDLWIHYAELVVGLRGHTAIANTSIPVGAFSVLFALVFINIGITRIAPGLRLSSAELLTIYVMAAVSTVLSSSGGMHFLIPTVTAAHYFADGTNKWAELLHKFIPHWIAQSDPQALKAFYNGNSSIDFGAWAGKIAVWCGFMFVFTISTLSLMYIIRKQWIEREHLPFPTVTLPLEVAREEAPILRDRFFWIGTIVTFAIIWWNSMAMNYPAMPKIWTRTIDLSPNFTTSPWNAMNPVGVTFFPFVIGIGYLLSTEVVFSCWFFYIVHKLAAVWGAATGWSAGTVGGQSTFPWLSFQAAGAFLGLAGVSLWVSRQHLRDVWRAAFGGNPDNDADAGGYRLACIALAFSILFMIGFTVVAGASVLVATVWVVVMLLSLLAATRIRAETGNAWPVGPQVDGLQLLVSFGGSGAFRPSDLTALTYVRAATAQQDFRSVCMSHQLDGFKFGDAVGIKPGRLAGAMVVAVGFGLVVSFIIALFVWTKYGALAKAEPWRSLMGRNSFTKLSAWLTVPTAPDRGGMTGVGLGIAFTIFLSWMRVRYVWWPLHPAGYCMSTTSMAGSAWMPFFIAWLAKVCIIRGGGMKLYKRLLPLFLGFIAGDFLGGATATLAACFFGNLTVYPANW